MIRIRPLLMAMILAIHSSFSNACGIAVHNEVTYRSLESFIPKTKAQQFYKDDIMKSPSFSQAGSFFPDWGYQCLGYNQQSEDAHWPTFIKTAVNYIREVYPISQFHTDKHVKGLISFVFAIMSHGMADVKWHSLSGLSDYFVVAMANSDFHGNVQEAHLAADTGAEFTLRHSNKLSYLNETWQVPINDMIEVYKRLYATEEHKDKKIPLKEHLQYCMTAAFAASKVDVTFGKLMFGYYGSKSPFLTEELYDYYKGGIQDMSAGVTDCYPELVDAFEYGSTHTIPDSLCANYFYTRLPSSSQQPKRLAHGKIPGYHGQFKSQLSEDLVYSEYDSVKGVLTITVDKNKQKQKQMANDRHHDSLPSVDVIVQPQTKDHEVFQNVRLRFQSPHSHELQTSIKFTTDDLNKCLSLNGEDDIILTLPIPSAKLGHQITSGDFNGDGQLDMAISAPYDGEEQTGTVFILNNSATTNKSSTNDIRYLSNKILPGTVKHGRFGWSMTTIDMNQDGIDDLAVSTPFGTGGIVEVYFGQVNIGLHYSPSIRIQFESQELLLLGTVLAGIDVDQNGFKDLVIGCPLCGFEGRPQVGVVYVFKSRHFCTTEPMQEIHQFTQPDIIFKNPNLNPSASYDHFGESILQVKNTILIGAPGYSTKSKQRVGRVYAFDLFTGALKWLITGTSEFQQYGRVLATDKNNEIVAISSPSEENIELLQKYWQAGTVRVYDWNVLDEGKDNIEHGMISAIKGRTNAGHLGQSISIFGNQQEGVGIWIGEPMSEHENGRVYKWMLNNRHKLECIRNNQAVLARFGSQIGPLGTDAICITSQRYGQNARYSGAVTFLNKR